MTHDEVRRAVICAVAEVAALDAQRIPSNLPLMGPQLQVDVLDMVRLVSKLEATFGRELCRGVPRAEARRWTVDSLVETVEASMR